MSGVEFASLRLSFTKRRDREYEVTATLDDGPPTTSTFTVPMTDDELEATIRELSATRSMLTDAPQVGDAATAADPADPADPTDSTDPATRTITPVAPYSRSARDFGVALANSLLVGEVGEMFDEARSTGGVRLCLNMTNEPALLRIPWEYLRRDGRDLALRSDSTVVRELDTREQAGPPSVAGQARMLGVIANPLGDLDVTGERSRIGEAVEKSGDKIDLRWLENCTFGALKRELEDAQDAGRPFHILHFVGHSAFTPDGNSVVLLCDDEGNRAEVEANSIAQLIGKHESLQLVVFNSCDGARTTLEDPFEGVATMLVQQGKSAVIAMQFEITDKAAKAFAEELYYQLVSRRLPIDAAVAEARTALLGVSPIEFATPVLFLRPGHLRLFEFVDAEAAPFPPPPVDAASPTAVPPSVTVPPAQPPPAPGASPDGWSKWPRRLVVACGAAVIAAVTGLFLYYLIVGPPDDDQTDARSLAAVPATVGTTSAVNSGAVPASVLVEVQRCLESPVVYAEVWDTEDPDVLEDGLATCWEALLQMRANGLVLEPLYDEIDERYDLTFDLWEGVLDDNATASDHEDFAADTDVLFEELFLMLDELRISGPSG